MALFVAQYIAPDFTKRLISKEVAEGEGDALGGTCKVQVEWYQYHLILGNRHWNTYTGCVVVARSGAD